MKTANIQADQMTFIKKIIFVLGVCALLFGCGTFKEGLVEKGNSEEAISNAILDFSNTSRLYSKNNVFSVTIHNPLHRMVLDSTEEGNGWIKGESYNGIVVISFFPTKRKIVSENITLNEVKTGFDFYEKNGKLFYWDNPNKTLTEESISFLKKYDLVIRNDEEIMVEFFKSGSTNNTKSVDYYFCENNISVYRKITSEIATGHYDPPLPNCSQ